MVMTRSGMAKQLKGGNGKKPRRPRHPAPQQDWRKKSVKRAGAKAR